MRAHTFQMFSDSFSYPFRPLAHLHYSFTTAPRFLQSLSHLSLSLISTASLFGFLLFPPTPIFPRFPRVQPHYRTVASVPSYLISARRRSHARRTACVPWEPLAPPFPRTVRTLSRSLHCSSHSIVVTLFCSLVTVTPPNSI